MENFKENSVSKKVALDIHEPLKFEHDFLAEVYNAVDLGYDVTIILEGAEDEEIDHPSNVYHNKDIEKAKFLIYSMNYWIKMKVVVQGKDKYENEKELEAILNSVQDQIIVH